MHINFYFRRNWFILPITFSPPPSFGLVVYTYFIILVIWRRKKSKLFCLVYTHLYLILNETWLIKLMNGNVVGFEIPKVSKCTKIRTENLPNMLKWPQICKTCMTHLEVTFCFGVHLFPQISWLCNNICIRKAGIYLSGIASQNPLQYENTAIQVQCCIASLYTVTVAIYIRQWFGTFKTTTKILNITLFPD